MTLRRRMAEFGFESNEDYEFQVRALFAARIDHLRCLAVCGESGRRKTAFANALAQALEYPHVVYHDFSLPEAPGPQVIVVSAEEQENPQPADAPLSHFERAVVEACAFSEAARTVLVLDQLQAADFRDQMRLNGFVRTHEWAMSTAAVRANPRHLLLVLISEQPLYHSLARVSYRVWTDARGSPFTLRPQDVGLGTDASALFEALAALFDALGGAPTPSEFARILDDLLHQVRTEDQLRHSLFGWTEHIDRAALAAPAIAQLLRRVVDALSEWLGAEEVVVGGDPPD
ncbi:MAG: hypothetical protein LW860_20190 [Xanthomonadaceae bacterium]|nr:hypothetical protein [Xanthomonadaceae bacterium]